MAMCYGFQTPVFEKKRRSRWVKRKKLVQNMEPKNFKPLDKCRLEQERQCTYNVTQRRVRATIVAVEKQ
jgi:hypothetical protein